MMRFKMKGVNGKQSIGRFKLKSFKVTASLLKGHGNEADFLGFLQKSVRHRFPTLHFKPF
jgi:hypothetical protein